MFNFRDFYSIATTDGTVFSWGDPDTHGNFILGLPHSGCFDIFRAITVALVAALLTSYWLAGLMASIPMLTLSAVASFALLTCAGAKLAISCWGINRRGLTTTIGGLLTIIFFGWLYIWGAAAFGFSFC